MHNSGCSGLARAQKSFWGPCLPVVPPSTTQSGLSAGPFPALHTKYQQQALGWICGFFLNEQHRAEKNRSQFFCLVPSKRAQAAHLGRLEDPCCAGGVGGMAISCSAHTLTFPGNRKKKIPACRCTGWITPTLLFAVGLLLFSAWNAVETVHVLAHQHRKMHWLQQAVYFFIFYERTGRSCSSAACPGGTSFGSPT